MLDTNKIGRKEPDFVKNSTVLVRKPLACQWKTRSLSGEEEEKATDQEVELEAEEG